MAEREPTTVEELRDAIASREAWLDTMKKANKIVRKKWPDARKVDALVADIGLPRPTAEKLLTPDFVGRLGFPAYELTSVNGKLKRLKERLATLETVSSEPLTFEGGRIEEDPDHDRLRIFFDGRIEEYDRRALKHAGFVWSPTWGCWQRKLTENARRDARALVRDRIPAAAGKEV